MEGTTIKGSLVSLFLGISIFLSGSLRVFDYNSWAVITLIIVAMLLVFIYLSGWYRTIIIKEDAIILKRLRSYMEIDKVEIREVHIKLTSTAILTKDGCKHRIVASGFKRSEMALLNNRLRDFQNSQQTLKHVKEDG